jgi:hypothetical protein
MSKNSTFVDMAIHGGIPFGSASGAAPELRDERSGGIFWPMGAGQACRRPVWTAPYGHFSAFQGQGRGSAANSSRFSAFLRTETSRLP